MRLAVPRHEGVGSQRIDRGIGAALAQFQRPRRRVGHDSETYPGQARLRPPVIVVALDDDLFILLGTDKREWPRSNELARDLVERPIRHNPTPSLRQIPQQGCIGFFQMKYQSALVGRFDVIYETVRRRLRASNLSFEQRVERPLNVAGSKRPSIEKSYSSIHVEDDGHRSRNIP